MTTYALIAAIEGNKSNLNVQRGIITTQRLFEDEAILCFKNWRANGGWLKDIPIYVQCPTKNIISEQTRHSFELLGVEYIEEFYPITDTFVSGFLNAPFVGKLMEERLEEDVLIKIDLDMNLIKPLPAELVNCPIDVCGQYDDFCSKQQRSVPDGWMNPFDTGFMITKRTNGFYSFFFDLLMKAHNEYDEQWEQVRAVTGDYYLEEYMMDKVVNTKLWEIQPVQRYQIGEWYTPVSEFSDKELLSVFFWHEHILSDPTYDKVREKIAFFNRMKKICDT